jgi:hypothetical protein
MSLRFDTVGLALVAALPELSPCIDRLVADWDNFEGEPPGQYLVFDTYRVWIEVLAGLRHPPDAEARELARRAFAFAEEMLSSEDLALRSLAIDACAETLPGTRRGHRLVDEFGGPALQRWIAEFGGAPDRPEQEPEVIDLWGVREVLAAHLPHLNLDDLPGISQPADQHRLRSLADARASDDGVVLLHAFGTSGMFVLARTLVVRCGEDALQELAQELAPVSHPNDADVLARGRLSVAYFNIPTGERVWNMTIASDHHARLTDDIDLWVAPCLNSRYGEIRARLSLP